MNRGWRNPRSHSLRVMLGCLAAAGIMVVISDDASLLAMSTFHAARATLHICNVPDPANLRRLPAISDPALPKEMRSLALFGRSIGGAFWIDWDESPWGPFLQVGLIGGLVTAAATSSWSVWASHMFVDADGPYEECRAVWGLPTSRCRIGIDESDPYGNVPAYGSAPVLHFGDGLGALGRTDSVACIQIGLKPWGEAPALREGPEADKLWAQQLRADRQLRGELGAGVALAGRKSRTGSAANDTGSSSDALLSQRARIQGKSLGSKVSLPWPLPEELVLPNLSGCLPPSGSSFSSVSLPKAATPDARRLLAYTARFRPGKARVLSARCPTGGRGLTPMVDFSDWQPLMCYEFLDIDAEVSSAEAV
eukprot:TRINITY_DN30644_c0_g1_i2.p1 TRINITY_DN30644_c0_g1~~TRINITY_DN30644_c0_g1_i2.p1  ORF type:complete len:366 (+),score=38.50 TRINITY_DN30644_c0_g1_i2:116-1213(+)